MEPEDRGQYLTKLSQLCLAAQEELAILDTAVMGRPLASYFEGPYTSRQYSHWAEAGYEAKGETSLNTNGFLNLTLRQPIGVVGCIIPWNVPQILFAHKVGPALAAGCTVVLKSSEKAPLACLKLAHLFQEAGFPPGVINIISGYGKPSGSTLASHMDVRAINFTGSTATGRLVQEAAAKSNLKRVILELGGKSPTIVFDDANIEQAAVDTAVSISFISGQACIANSRIYVQDTVAAKFKKAFTAAFTNFKAGDPLDPETTHGPQADAIQHKRVSEYLKLANEGKGKVEAGGGPLKVDGHENALFIAPTIIADEPEDAPGMKEEIFGPVVGINVFKTEGEAIAKAVDSEFGLYSSVYTNNISRALRVAKAMEAGTVGINCTSPTVANDLPFGGAKGSGTGREGYGYSLDNYLETKSVMIKLDAAED
jgi:aldehyde dehydrogenase (NAD+)